MILIIDKELKSSERKLIDSHCSTYELNRDDMGSWLDEIPKVDIYLVNINDLQYCERSFSMCWLETNHNRIIERKMDLVYYRQTSCVKKENLPRLKCFVIKTFPITCNSKEDLFERLKHDALPYVRSGWSFCCGCCCSKISMGKCLKGIGSGVRFLPCF